MNKPNNSQSRKDELAKSIIAAISDRAPKTPQGIQVFVSVFLIAVASLNKEKMTFQEIMECAFAALEQIYR
ncbi:hypothetical protein D0962_17935 [Leptolyngbyaceae cyanobacterium CCMR0082]|uniref:Uncharacterized protein n=1 Tax=Adonisia turfae CCMR0082 TaxID=2304604 RepID=A0A6M0S8G0_9CYAN|nr:hypothetical protein [Adonisia turfae]NEZ64646.1 hypothetical protein [Adonisia turfae CCMR0082]